MSADRLRVAPIAGAIGAEITGVDLAGDVDDATIAEIRRAWLEYGVVFFRDQVLDAAAFLAFARRIGDPVEYPFVKGIDGFPEIIAVTKLPHETVNFGGIWHSDTVYLERPPMGTMLLAREVPPYGGDTLFASMYAAYDALSSGMQRLLEDLRAVNTSALADVSKTRDGLRGDDNEGHKEFVAEHPVVRVHPETGRKALYVNVAHTLRFVDMTEDESRPLLRFLFEHAVRPEFTCRFQWRAGSIAMWDNRCVMHNPRQRLPRPHAPHASHHARRRPPPMSPDRATPWPTIPAMVRDVARRIGDAEAVVDGDDARRLRNPAHDGRLAAAGALLASGIERGDRVAIWAPNSLEWIVAALGVTTAGGVLVPINTRFRGTEASYVLERSGARVLFAVRGFLDTDYPALLAEADAELPALEHTVLLAGAPGAAAISWDEFVASGSAVTEDELDARVVSIGADDPCDVVFTSGTTGNPKGVVMTHGQTLRAYLDWCDWADLRPGDRYLIANPFFHIFGYKAGCLACLMRGATIFPLAVFDPGVVLEIVERERISVLPGPPTIYHALLDHPDLAHRDIASLRVAVTGAADIPVELIRRVREELPFERILTGYGLTEAGTVTGSKPDDDFEHIATTVGVPWPGFEVRIVTERAPTRRSSEPGEVVVRGATVTRGYLDDPGATAAAIDGDGWLHTGDLGTIDGDGYLRIVGRIKDMFIVGGFNAYPAEIENLMLRHPRHRAGRGDRRARRAARRSREGVRRVAPGPADRVRRDHRVGTGRDGELQGAPLGRVSRRVAGERHGQGRQGRAAARRSFAS